MTRSRKTLGRSVSIALAVFGAAFMAMAGSASAHELPTVQVYAPWDGAVLASPVTASFETWNADGMACKWDDDPIISPCSSPSAPKTLGGGTHTFALIATNEYGSTTVTRTFTVVPPPTVAIPTPTEGQTIGSPLVANFTLGGGAAETVTCQLDGGPVFTSCASPVGPQALAPGTHTLKVTAANFAGSNSATRTFNVIASPTVAITAPGAGETVGSPVTASFTLGGGAPSSVTCQWDSDPVTTACTSPQGPKALTPGSHSFKVTATNVAGSASATRNFTVIAPPTVAITSPTASEIVGSPVTASFTLGGGAASSVTCQWDGDAASSCTSPLGPKTLTPGPHSVTVTASNVAGTASVTRNFTVIAPPTVAITSPTASETVGSPVTASFTLGGGAASSVTCQWDGDAAISSCAGPQGPKTLAPGSHSFKVTAANVAGSASVTRTFTVIAPPTVAITSPTASEIVGSPVTATFTLGGGAASSVTCHWDSDAATSCASPLGPKTLAPGPHSVTVTASNVAGTASVTRNFTVIAPPTVAIPSPTEGEIVGSPVTASFTLGGGSAATVTCQWDSDAATSSCASPQGPKAFTPGPHSFKVTATNVAGTASVTRSFVVTAKPTINIVSPTEGQEVGSPVIASFTLGGGAATSVTCQWDDQPISGICTSPLPPVDLAARNHRLTVTASNVAGITSKTVNFTVVEPPTVAVTVADDDSVASPVKLGYKLGGGEAETVTCQWDDEPILDPCPDPLPLRDLAPGEHTFKVTATNAAGTVVETKHFTVKTLVKQSAVEVPVIRQTTNLELDSGDVFLKVPGSDKFEKLTASALVPIGTVVDATAGKARLTLANADSSTYGGVFWDGLFQIFQGTGDNPIAIMKLRNDLSNEAGIAVAKASLLSSKSTADLTEGFNAWTARRKGKKRNGVWGDAKGKFRTSGKGGSASVRGTRWYLADYTYGTLFKVSRGSVTINPLRGKNFILKAGKSKFVWYVSKKGDD